MANYPSMKAFTIALKAMQAGLMPFVQGILTEQSNKLAADVRDRVQSQGKSSTGGSFSPYSKGHIYKKKKHGKGVYGQKTDAKNFYFQGTMWNSFTTTSVKKLSPTYVSAGIDFVGSNVYKSNAELEDIHSGRESQNIAAPSQQEELDLVERLEEQIYAYIESVL